MSGNTCDKLHMFDAGLSGVEPPLHLNDPFSYDPHPLCRIAADEVFRYAESRPEWRGELSGGKMFGVLVVRDEQGTTGFLAAFSGNLAGRNDHSYFVPPVFDMLDPEGFFRRGEAEISEMNRRIALLESDDARAEALGMLKDVETEAVESVAAFRKRTEEARALRRARRAENPGREVLDLLDDESRREKSELRRLKESLARKVGAARAAVVRFDEEIAALKSERRRRSEELQRQLFGNFIIVNARGERRGLLSIFEDAVQALPPAGAGECAAPKLFQYAFLHGLTPLSIAEFWYGASPKGEVRRHGRCYPACRGKCKPILEFMLDGIYVERRDRPEHKCEPEIVFEDDSILVVGKPAGMLSVDGKIDALSVEEWARRRCEGRCEPKMVHRLDMDVSGLLLIAKGLDSYRNLQNQFLHRTVEKHYTALLEGVVTCDEGRIELAVRPDPDDRPRQIVDPVHGKRAVTLFSVAERREGFTLVDFEPVTGRTHQLRVHSASAEGLDAPIVGDTLYGAEPASRLFLHSRFLAFDHPVTGLRMTFELPVKF